MSNTFCIEILHRRTPSAASVPVQQAVSTHVDLFDEVINSTGWETTKWADTSEECQASAHAVYRLFKNDWLSKRKSYFMQLIESAEAGGREMVEKRWRSETAWYGSWGAALHAAPAVVKLESTTLFDGEPVWVFYTHPFSERALDATKLAVRQAIADPKHSHETASDMSEILRLGVRDVSRRFRTVDSSPAFNITA